MYAGLGSFGVDQAHPSLGGSASSPNAFFAAPDDGDAVRPSTTMLTSHPPSRLASPAAFKLQLPLTTYSTRGSCACCVFTRCAAKRSSGTVANSHRRIVHCNQ